MSNNTKSRYTAAFFGRTQLHWIYSFAAKKQVYADHLVAEIPKTDNVSKRKHVSSFHNPVDIGNRAINAMEL